MSSAALADPGPSVPVVLNAGEGQNACIIDLFAVDATYDPEVPEVTYVEADLEPFDLTYNNGWPSVIFPFELAIEYTFGTGSEPFCYDVTFYNGDFLNGDNDKLLDYDALQLNALAALSEGELVDLLGTPDEVTELAALNGAQILLEDAQAIDADAAVIFLLLNTANAYPDAPAGDTYQSTITTDLTVAAP